MPDRATSLDSLLRLLREHSIDNVVLGGGEPFLWPHGLERLSRLARELGMKVMLGCMVESSVGVASAAMVASEVDWLDLDGNLLIADDPFEGLELGDDCRWRLPGRPGLGVWRRA